MKKTYFIMVTAVAMLCSCSQELDLISTDIPPQVASNFQAKFPNATDAEWEAQKEDGHLVFEVEFEFEGKEREAKFKPDGSLIETERD